MTRETFSGAAARLAHHSALLLRWSPDEFWDATPAEMALAIAPPGEIADAPDGALIDALRRRFPDDERRMDHG